MIGLIIIIWVWETLQWYNSFLHKDDKSIYSIQISTTICILSIIVNVFFYTSSLKSSCTLRQGQFYVYPFVLRYTTAGLHNAVDWYVMLLPDSTACVLFQIKYTVNMEDHGSLCNCFKLCRFKNHFHFINIIFHKCSQVDDLLSIFLQ